MRHDGSPHDALRSTVGAAAKLTVVDDDGGKPIFKKWSPSPYDIGAASPVPPPMRQNDEARCPGAWSASARCRAAPHAFGRLGPRGTIQAHARPGAGTMSQPTTADDLVANLRMRSARG